MYVAAGSVATVAPLRTITSRTVLGLYYRTRRRPPYGAGAERGSPLDLPSLAAGAVDLTSATLSVAVTKRRIP
jgi:hypothetical protein